MRRRLSWCSSWCLAVVTAAVASGAGLGLGGWGPGLSQAAACSRDGGCRGQGYRPHPGYSAPAVYSYVSPAALYGVPGQDHRYSAYGDGFRRRGPTFAVGTYTTRLNIFRDARWNYSAAYYTSPVTRRGHYGRRAHRAHLVGPYIRVLDAPSRYRR